MSLSVTPVETGDDQKQLYRLLFAYETSLPERLRHGLLDAASFEALLTPPNSAFIARYGGEPAGCVFLMHLDSSTAVVQRLYVTPTVRGSGAGRALMSRAIDEARSRGYRRIALDTDAGELRAAHSLYVSLGFRACDPFMPVAYDNAHFMELPLQT